MPLVSVCACAAAAAGAAGGAILSIVTKYTPASLYLSMAEMKRAVDKIRAGGQKSQARKFFGVNYFRPHRPLKRTCAGDARH
jgi:hypothetical protein